MRWVHPDVQLRIGRVVCVDFEVSGLAGVLGVGSGVDKGVCLRGGVTGITRLRMLGG